MSGESVKHNNNINTLRFLGALFVLWGHTFALCYGPGGGKGFITELIRPFTGYRAGLPGVGIGLFFVLSGYLVCKSYLNREKLLVYLEARILRIYPALWVNLLLVALLLGPIVTTLDLQAYFSHAQTWEYLRHNMWLYPDIFHRLPGVFDDNPRPGVNGSLWTLPIEVRMYVFVAVLGVCGVLARRIALNLVALSLVVFYLAAPEHFFLLEKLRHERFALYFLLGALFYINRQSIPLNLTGLIVLTLALVSLYLPDSRPAFFNPFYALWFAYLTLYIALHPRLKLPDLGRHGDFSYGLYLYAYPVTQIFILVLGPENPWLILPLVFVSTLLLAAASWFAIEKPALALKGRLMQRSARVA
ncbi:MAG: acyltransferase [Pseudomonadota bacterium]